MKNKNCFISFKTDSITNIPFEKFQKDFTFVINNVEYQTNRIFADILSPLILQYHYIDDSINSISMLTENEGNFQDILDIVENFEGKQIVETEILFFCEVFARLENRLYFTLIPEFSEDITLSNALVRITKKLEFYKIKNKKEYENYENNKFYQISFFKEEIDFIAHHFFEFDVNDLKSIESGLLEEIIRNENLTIKTEDDLLSFVLDVYSEEPKTVYLFENVIFENVSEAMMKKFIAEFDPNDINIGVWNPICNCLLSNSQFIQKDIINRTKISKSYNNRYQKSIDAFDYSYGNDLNGILKNLTNTTKGNIYLNKTIDITASSCYFDKSYNQKNLVDFVNNNYFQSKDEPNQWVCFDFKEKKVQLAHYAIKSSSLFQNDIHLKNWVIEVSDDNKTWVEIDKRENFMELNSPWRVCSFEIQVKSNYVRYIKLRQIGPNISNNNFLNLAVLEFFGNLKY